MIGVEIEVEGGEVVQGDLRRIARVARGSWASGFVMIGNELKRFAASISPVITGSYQDSHSIRVAAKEVELSIDPAARNTASGLLVTSYAEDVESRHQVYDRTGTHIAGHILGLEDWLAREMGL